MKFSEFLNEAIQSKSKNNLSLNDMKSYIQRNEIVKARSALLIYNTYKAYKSTYKDDSDFVHYVEKNINKYKFFNSDGHNKFIESAKEIVEDAKTLKSPELKSKYESQGEVIIDADHYALSIKGELTTTTGNLSLRWNLYDQTDGEILVLSSGVYAYNGQTGGYKVGDTIKLIDNDKLIASYSADIKEIVSISKFKQLLQRDGYSTKPPKMYQKADGKTKADIAILKTNISPEFLFKNGK